MARRRRFALWGLLFFVLASAALLEAGRGERPRRETRVEFIGEVRLPKAERFAVIRNPATGHQGIYKDGEAIYEGGEPLPVGKIIAVRDDALVIAVRSGRKFEIGKGARLPGPRELIFVSSALIDTFRYQVRSGVATTSGGEYSVVEIVGRQALLERAAIPGKDRVAAGPLAFRGLPQGQRGAPRPGGHSPLPKGSTVAEVVDHIPLAEVKPDTWDVPKRQVMELGNHLEPLLMETLRSATPTFSMAGGVGLRINTSMGSGTLDRRGFKIGYVKMAQRTGLEVGDRILFVNGQAVNSAGGLFRVYRQLKSDSSLSEVKVVINRNNQLRTLTYRLR